jgi:NADH:ubiquinone oxidoreductase subunit 2 (subunit N)
VSTVLSGAYYLRIMRMALLEAAPTPAVTGGLGDDLHLPRERRLTESPALVVVPLVVTAAVTLLLGVAPGALLELVRAAARVP